MHIPFFCFVVDIYVGFTPASSNLALPSYDSPWSIRECTVLHHTLYILFLYIVFFHMRSTHDIAFSGLRTLASDGDWPHPGEIL
jgi:hypothetical protein